MTQQKERQVLLWTGAAAAVLAVGLFVLTFTSAAPNAILEPLFVLALAVACQCAMRLILTTKLQYNHDRLFVTTSGWFQKNALDRKLTESVSVQQWANLQTYDPDAFSVSATGLEKAVQHTCTLELMNEINGVLAFLSLLFLLLADNKPLALIPLLVVSIGFSALAVATAVRARQFRFQVKAGRVF